VLADRRAARAARHSGPSPPLGNAGGDRSITTWLARRRLAEAVAEQWLGEAQAIPAGVLLGFVEGLLDRRAALLRQGEPASAARVLAVIEAVQAFQAGAWRARLDRGAHHQPGP
jgi:hypothetical protein